MIWRLNYFEKNTSCLFLLSILSLYLACKSHTTVSQFSNLWPQFLYRRFSLKSWNRWFPSTLPVSCDLTFWFVFRTGNVLIILYYIEKTWKNYNMADENFFHSFYETNYYVCTTNTSGLRFLFATTTNINRVREPSRTQFSPE